MTFVLSQSNYGKSEIRLVKVVRGEGRHELSDVTVDVMLDGDFDAAHGEGDNSALIATDTMRNGVYVLAAKHDVSDLEPFGRALVEHFVAAGPTVERARIRLVEHPWARLG
jgi:urate oxidase